MSKFVWSNTNFEQAEVILVGIPDESGSKSYRSGSSNGPDQIRKISNQRELFGPNRIAQSMTGEIGLNVWDYGNISKIKESGAMSSCTTRQQKAMTMPACKIWL